MNSLIALRFLQGCAGSAPLAIGGGTITDLIPQERRGKYMGIYSLGPTLGPIIGPVVRIFESQSWLSMLYFSSRTYPAIFLNKCSVLH